jgi:uncharacterized protein (TIGR00725 family)
MKKLVSVIGQGTSSERQDLQAFELGKMLSQAGYSIVCGGKGGVMEAVARGAAETGGLCIGLLPGHDQMEANRYISVAIPTGLGHARNYLVVQAGEVVVAVGGGYGTLSEIAFALTMGKTVIGINTWKAISGSGIEAEIIAVQSVSEAVEMVDNFFARK